MLHNAVKYYRSAVIVDAAELARTSQPAESNFTRKTASCHAERKWWTNSMQQKTDLRRYRMGSAVTDNFTEVSGIVFRGWVAAFHRCVWDVTVLALSETRSSVWQASFVYCLPKTANIWSVL